MDNYHASAIAIAVAVKLNNTPEFVIGLMVVAMDLFAFMEMAKPVYDSSCFQFFLRLPLQTAILCYKHNAVGCHVPAAALLLGFGTMWHEFFLLTFTPELPSPLLEALGILFGMSKLIVHQSYKTTSLCKNPPVGWMIGFLFMVSFLGIFSLVPLMPLRKIVFSDA